MRTLYKTIPKVKTTKGGKRRMFSFAEMKKGLADGKLTTFYPKKNRARLVSRHGRIRVINPKQEKVKNA